MDCESVLLVIGQNEGIAGLITLYASRVWNSLDRVRCLVRAIRPVMFLLTNRR